MKSKFTIYTPMPNQRAPGQKQVITLMDEEFVREIGDAMVKAGYSDRSAFIRDAVFEKLKAMNIHCDYTLAMAPPRAGKGGPKSKASAGGVNIINSKHVTVKSSARVAAGAGMEGKKPVSDSAVANHSTVRLETHKKKWKHG
jgi:Arc/MetJ-type ribon-helix-helix transcriptional regulator